MSISESSSSHSGSDLSSTIHSGQSLVFSENLQEHFIQNFKQGIYILFCDINNTGRSQHPKIQLALRLLECLQLLSLAYVSWFRQWGDIELNVLMYFGQIWNFGIWTTLFQNRIPLLVLAMLYEITLIVLGGRLMILFLDGEEKKSRKSVVLAYLIQTFSLFYLPMVGLCISFINCPTEFPPDLPSPAAETHCGGTAHVVVGALALATTIITIILGGLISILYFPWNPQRNNFVSTSNGRIWLLLFAAKTVLGISAAFFHGHPSIHQWRTLVHSLLLIASFGSAFGWTMYTFPFYHFRTNLVACGVFCFGLVTALFRFLTPAFPNPLIPFIMYVIFTIPCIVTSIYFAKKRLSRLGTTTVNKTEQQHTTHFSNDFEVEISTRFAYFSSDEIDMDTVTMMYLNATEQFPQSVAVKIAHAIFLLPHAEELQLLSVVINRSKKTLFSFTNWDNEYLLYCLDKARKQQLYKLDGGLEEIQRKIRQAMRFQEQCTKCISAFWSQLLKEQDLAGLTDIVAQIERNEILAETIYKKLLLKFPKNTRVLRAYGLFLEEVKNDAELAHMAYRSADEVEEEKARHHKRYFKRKKGQLAPAQDNFIHGATSDEEEDVIPDTVFGNEWALDKEHKERSKMQRSKRIEQVRQRKYKQNIEKSRSTALRKLSVAVLVTAVVLFLDLMALYIGTRLTLQQFQVSLDLVEDITESRVLAQHLIFTLRQAQLFGREPGGENITKAAKELIKEDALQLKVFLQDDIMNNYENEKIRRWWMDPIFNQSTLVSLDASPNNVTRAYTNVSLMELSMKFISNALYLAANETAFLQTTPNPPPRFIYDNGIDTLLNGYTKAIELETEQLQLYEDEFHVVMGVLLGLSLAILLVAILGLFVPALRKIREERMKALRLFLAIPKSTIATIYENLGTKEDEVKDFEEEEFQDDVTITSEVQQSSGIPIIRKLILRYGLSVAMVLVLIAVLFAVPFSFVRNYDEVGMEINYSGSREYLLDRLVFLSWELIYNGPATWPGGRNQVRGYMQNTTNLLQLYDNAVLYGNPELGLREIGSFTKKLYYITFEKPCVLYKSDAECFGAQTLVQYILRDAELLWNAPESTLLRNSTVTAEISFLHSQLESFLSEFWSLFKQYAVDEMDKVATQISIIYAISFPVLLFCYFSLRPLEKRVREENMRTMKMLLMIPIDVIDQVEEIKTYLDSGLKGNLSDKKINQILQDKLERSKKILDASTDAVVVINEQGSIEVFNPAAEKLFGYSCQEALNQNVKILVPEDVAIVHQSYIERYRTTKVPLVMGRTTQQTARTKSGTLVPISISLSETTVGLNKSLYAAFIKDITVQKEYEKELLKERGYSEQLLSSLLPESIAKQLKEEIRVQGSEGVLIAEAYKEVTVLFADLVGFTTLSGKIRPTELVQLLNKLFSKWDALAGKYGVEKIKTIGDCYMAASGVPLRSLDHAENALEFAVEILTSLGEFNKDMKYNLQVRIGLNSGPVVAGVIGTKKMAFDLWGDTVNVASRMESTGLPGRIQVSSSTFELLKEEYIFEERGRQQVKGKGVMLTYLYKERRYDRTPSGHKIRRQIFTPMQSYSKGINLMGSLDLSPATKEEAKECDDEETSSIESEEPTEEAETVLIDLEEFSLPNTVPVPTEETEQQQPPTLTVTEAPSAPLITTPPKSKDKKLRKTTSRLPPKSTLKPKKTNFKQL